MKLDHQHMIVNATVTKPPREGDEGVVCDWLSELIEAVGMRTVIGPHAHYCKADENEGITASCNIETSHAALHVWDKVDPPLFRFDLYSCAEFDPATVLGFVRRFDPTTMEWIVLDRNDGIRVGEYQSEVAHG